MFDFGLGILIFAVVCILGFGVLIFACQTPRGRRSVLRKCTPGCTGLSGGDALEAVGGRKDGDALVAAERMQIGVA